MSAHATEHKTMNLKLIVWRQDGPDKPGRFEHYEARNITEHHSFLEMLDVVNEDLIKAGKDPIAFDHDCREGICGMCSAVVNGVPHGGQKRTTLCQLHMRKFKDGDVIYLEPWRARAFPIIKDLIVDRGALDKLIQAAGWVSCHTGGVPDGNAIPVSKRAADYAMDAAECIGCGACVAACPNGAANLFTGAKIAHLNLLPQGQAERLARTEAMVETMEEYFGSCTNYGECEAACPKQISIDVIALMNADYLKAKIRNRKKLART
jgi:succinate dehydrogenase / fumarate reductase iron-sulfur subunit